ncbi:L-type lectin-domain containing receptor kinase IX.1-like [Ziziphus jujuba]|uniref:non-specific serine/threonine protein kinase n=1 Tax=Ziziphus jujuba TaxID=326968 RepID=A0A6P4ACX9_ZIZJJ|nr:L-type lectin-domain containing receptor kinase IX.1-like [Ziziphus jujuba]
MALCSSGHTHLQVQHLLSSLTFTIFLLLITIPYSSPLEFDYPVLDQTNRTLIAQGNTTYLGSGIELTKNKTHQIGHVLYFMDLKLWDKASGRVANFTTNFSFIVYSTNQAGKNGDGFAFFLAQPPFRIPYFTDGSRIGLMNEGGFASSSNPFVAVEFDTFPNRVDPQDMDEHVGINVNSMVSRKTTSWLCNITTWNVYNATVSYSSTTKNLSVSFTGYKDSVPVQQSLSDEIDLADYLPEMVTIGFSAANGKLTSRHILRSWSFRSEEVPTRTNSYTGLIVGLSIGVCAFIGVLSLICLCLWKWKKRNKREEENVLVLELSMDNDFERSSGARRFSYDELVAATNNFSEEEKLGQGGFGGVYRGFLQSIDSFVAIKKVSTGSEQGLKEYASEVKTISRLRHRNLVQLIGWCHRKKDLLLIYEFMSNGSLDSHLFKGKSSLTWAARYNIARGLASALLYLHEEWEQCVVHRDIKSSNVLLDSNFNAKLGDFGLARLVDHEKGSQTTVVAGTLGYLAPECFTTGIASRESDVYSFGVVILEIACGRKPIEPTTRGSHMGLVQWVWELYGMEKVLEAADPRLCGEFDEQQMERLMVVGLWCAHPDQTLRPSIKQAIYALDFEAPLPVLPPEMPLPTYGHPSVQRSNARATCGSEDGQLESSTNSTSNYTVSSRFTSSSGTASPCTALLASTQVGCV